MLLCSKAQRSNGWCACGTFCNTAMECRDMGGAVYAKHETQSYRSIDGSWLAHHVQTGCPGHRILFIDLVLAVPDLWHSSLWFRYVQTQHWPTDAIRGKAKKPDDWDDEEDGEWEAPMIDNPEYKGHFGFKKFETQTWSVMRLFRIWLFRYFTSGLNAAAMWHSPHVSKGYKDQNTLTYMQYYSLHT